MNLYSQAFPFWNDLSELEQQDFLDATAVRTLSPGELVPMMPGMYMVNDGQIAAYESTAAAGEPVQTFPFLSCLYLSRELFADPETAPMTLRAEEESEICIIPYVDWNRLTTLFPGVDDFTGTVRFTMTEKATVVHGIAVDPAMPY